MALHTDYEDSENDNVFVDHSINDDMDCGSYEYDSSDTESEDDENMSTENKRMWNLITSMNKENPHLAPGDKKPKRLRRSSFKDISIKVESDIYELDRIALALKSDYFEKLFTGDFDQKENEFLEIQTIDTDTFYAVVEIVYGRELINLLNIGNFAALLLALDYLQMEIDLRIFHDFLQKNLQVQLKHFPNMGKLLRSIEENPNFTYLLPIVYQYFSIHLIDAFHCEEFLSFNFELFVKIINRNKFPRYTKEKRKIARICTEWICIDIGNRLKHMIHLVNAAKYRYNFDFRVDDRSMNTKFLLEIDDKAKQKKEMERYFNNLLNQNGQIDFGKQENIPDDVPACIIINRIDEHHKWATFVENDFLYDITVKVDEKIYKLHRYKLCIKSSYFLEESISKSAYLVNDGISVDRKETPLKPINKDEILHLDGIEQLTFETVVEFMYFDTIDFDSNISIVNLLKASELLDIYELKRKCQMYVIDHLNADRIYDEFIGLINFCVGKEGYKDLCSDLRDHICMTWPKLGTLTDFCSILRSIFISILTLEKLEINHADEILDIASKWIAHDAPNRYQFLPRIANAITRHCLMDYANCELETPSDWNDCSQQFIKDKLWQMLSSFRSDICSSSVDPTEEPQIVQKPMFIATPTEDKNLLAVLDLDFNKIVEIHSLKTACNEDVTAALIGHNLYFLFDINRKYHFQMYNLSTKRLFSLATFPRLMSANYLSVEPNLLNCNDEIYCCYENGTVLKYSIEINRWLVISSRIQGRSTINYTSNGNTLFRLSKVIHSRQFIAETYNFLENSWIPMPQFSSRLQKWCFSKANQINLTIVNDSLAIVLESDIVIFDQQLQTWRDFEFTIPILSTQNCDLGSFIYVQHEGDILCMRNRRIFRISSANGESSSYQKTLPDSYSSVNAIHTVCK